jgi:hypothetical protein
MAHQQARIRIVAAANAGPNDETNLLAGVKLGNGISRRRGSHANERAYRKSNPANKSHNVLPFALAARLASAYRDAL